ncbi:uncharacterized protein PAC_01271 [Phialocephala subalpina]|uniref:Zn(2)-C6 fungal-type domain-containing protein n=1 Tax=Phialocephala subalpina TaxID=576137 RepID=A0A1L7WF59_9HELO|nr:uncharacterized protein PAC_01271 [Phialocephala subalpina]
MARASPASASSVDSQSPQSQTSGRRVKHSRNGCASCKERRLRCSEERPSCQRCLDDDRSCEYVLRLIWAEESARRGIKHGRGKHAEVTFVDPKPSRDLIGKAEWNEPRRQRSYFLNTIYEDVDGTQVRTVTKYNGIYRSPRLQSAPKVLELSSADGMLLQYYQAQVCQTLTLVDDASNCYRQIILPLSMSHESVMRSILAVGALHLSLNQTSTTLDYYSLALQQKQKTLHQLRNDIASSNGGSNNHILVSMLMLCLFDITDNCQTSWATHVSAAANLMGMEKVRPLDPSLVSFVSKFFATRDVMGRSACGARSKFRKIAWENPEEVDKTAGCSSELLEIISSITDASRQMAENAGGDDPALARYVNSIENRLDDLVQLLPAPNSESTSKSELLVLAQTSSLIHNAAKIYFYTTLHSAVPSTHIVRRLVNEQVDLIKRLPKMRSAHLWSIFVTALYAFDDEQRIFFLEQFDKVKEVLATRSATQAAKSIVQTVWKNRDLEADSEHMVKPGMSDWARFVRPMSENLSLA